MNNKKNLLERGIEIISPSWAIARELARFNLDRGRTELENLKRYEAAGRGKRNQWGYLDSGSVNMANRPALHILRSKSRHLVENNAWARRAIKVITNHTVGIGIVPTFTHSNDTNKKKLQSVFESWTEIDNCDWDGVNDFRGLQKLVMRIMAESGEVIIRRRKINLGPGRVPFQLQVQEPDVIDTSKDGLFDENGCTIQGVEFDNRGKRVAYWLFDTHPGESVNSVISRRIDAKEIIHVFETLRSGQVRGIPFGVSAMVSLKDFDEYEDAQLVKQKVAAYFTGFVESPYKAQIVARSKAAAADAARMKPGNMEYLNPGEKISFSNPPVVNDYSAFSKNVLLKIASAYDITYEALTGDLSGTNFSSSRMGWLEMANNVYDWQYQILIPKYLQRVFNWFNEAAIVGGLIKDGGSCKWTAPRRQMYDPYKETMAKILMQQAGYDSWGEIVRADGWDPNELRMEIAQELDEFDKLGFATAGDPRVATKIGLAQLQPEQTEASKPKPNGTTDK